MTKIMKHKYALMTIFIAVFSLFILTGCSQSKTQLEELGKAIIESEKKIKALESEMNILTDQNAKLILELDSIGAPAKIKYVKGYQGNVKIGEDTSFKLMPTGTSETLATLKAGTVVETLAVGEVTTFDPC